VVPLLASSASTATAALRFRWPRPSLYRLPRREEGVGAAVAA
jgi:hypothetical protein